MLKRLIAVTSGTVLLLTLVNTTTAQMMEGDVLISGVWAQATANMMMADTMDDMPEDDDMDMPMMESSAVYMTIENTTDTDFTLTAAETGMAGSAAIAEATGDLDEEGMMETSPVEGGVTIPAGESVTFSEDGLQITLDELTGMLTEGHAFTLNLTFEAADGEPFLINVGVPLLTEPPAASDIVIATAWARPTASQMMEGTEPMADEVADAADAAATEESEMDMAGAPTSAVYMFIQNTGSEDVALISGETDAADIVEIHETSVGDDDVMMMRPIMDGLVIPAGETVELRPGGFHVMLMDLPQPLVTGDAIYVELTFDNGDTIPLAAPIEDRIAGMMQGM